MPADPRRDEGARLRSGTAQRGVAEPQRLNETVPPGQSFTPPCSTGRASTPAAVRTLAAMLARMPDSQIVTTGFSVSTPSSSKSTQQAERDVEGAGNVTVVAPPLGLLPDVEHFHGALFEQVLELVEFHGHDHVRRAAFGDVAGKFEEADGT